MQDNMRVENSLCSGVLIAVDFPVLGVNITADL